jgi:F1F0 ATPase subunit 2
MDAQAMTDFHLNEPASLVLHAGVWLGCGILIGALHFGTLQWSVRRFVAGGAPLLLMTLQLGRLAFLAVALAVVGRFGASAMLVAATGILAARTAALRTGESA